MRWGGVRPGPGASFAYDGLGSGLKIAGGERRFHIDDQHCPQRHLERRIIVANRLVSSALLLAIVVTSGVAADGDGPAPFRITTRRNDDRVTVRVEQDQACFSVHSPFGISHATIERTGKQWPQAVMLRLHLHGLENFHVSGGKLGLDLSASIRDGKPVVRIWQAGQEDRPLDRKSPGWMDVRILGADGQPAKAIPLQGGYFEIPLPGVLFQDNPRSLTVKWIDFYRS